MWPSTRSTRTPIAGRDWRHIRRSVLAALGTVFGSVALIHIRRDTADYPLEKPDFVWQDFRDEYIDYVLDALLRWGDSQGRRKIQQFDPWLVSTGWRRPVSQNGDVASRPSRLPESAKPVLTTPECRALAVTEVPCRRRASS
jgi:hypothetical protein